MPYTMSLYPGEPELRPAVGDQFIVVEVAEETGTHWGRRAEVQLRPKRVDADVEILLRHLRNRICHVMRRTDVADVEATWRAFFKLEQYLADIGVIEEKP